MTTSKTTSLSITFSTNTVGHLSLEVDSRPEGYNAGKTTFYPGDSPVVLLYSSANVILRQLRATQGSQVFLGTGLLAVDQWVACTMQKTISLPKPVYSGFTVLESYGDYTGDYTTDGQTLYFPSPRLASMRVAYNALFSAYRLSGSFTYAPVVVYAVGEIL